MVGLCVRHEPTFHWMPIIAKSEDHARKITLKAFGGRIDDLIEQARSRVELLSIKVCAACVSFFPPGRARLRRAVESRPPRSHPGKSSCNHEKHEMGKTWNQRIIHPAGEKEPLPKLFCFRVFRVFRGLNSRFKGHGSTESCPASFWLRLRGAEFGRVGDGVRRKSRFVRWPDAAGPIVATPPPCHGTVTARSNRNGSAVAAGSTSVWPLAGIGAVANGSQCIKSRLRSTRPKCVRLGPTMANAKNFTPVAGCLQAKALTYEGYVNIKKPFATPLRDH